MAGRAVVLPDEGQLKCLSSSGLVLEGKQFPLDELC